MASEIYLTSLDAHTDPQEYLMGASAEFPFFTIAPEFGEASLGWLCISLFLVVLHFVAEPMRWHVLFPGKATVREWLGLFSFAAFVSYLFPFKLGIPLRLLLLRLKVGLSPGQISAGMVADASCYYGLWLVCGLTGFSIVAHRLPRPDLPAPVWLVTCLIGSLGVFLLLKKIKNKILASSWRVTASAALSVFSFEKFQVVGGIVLLDVLSHLLRHLALAKLFGLNVPATDIFALSAASILAGLLSFTPMGLGGYDTVLIAGLTQYGVSLKTATFVAVANRALTLTVAVLVGVFGAYVMRLNPFGFRKLRGMRGNSPSLPKE